MFVQSSHVGLQRAAILLYGEQPFFFLQGSHLGLHVGSRLGFQLAAILAWRLGNHLGFLSAAVLVWWSGGHLGFLVASILFSCWQPSCPDGGGPLGFLSAAILAQWAGGHLGFLLAATLPILPSFFPPVSSPISAAWCWHGAG